MSLANAERELKDVQAETTNFETTYNNLGGASRADTQVPLEIQQGSSNAARAPMHSIAQGQDIARDSSANTLARSNVSTSGTCNNVTFYCAIA